MLDIRSFVVVAVVAATGVAAADKECIPVDDNTACAPWNKGYSINATALGRVYGLSGPIPDAKFWDKMMREVTSGGESQARPWRDWVGCSGYNGQLIQYFRSYACLTDLHYYSAGCNKDVKPPAQLCGGVCDAYGAAVTQLVSNPTLCPLNLGNVPQSRYEEVSQARSFALAGASSCKWLAGTYGLGGTGTQQCIYGVDADHYGCGFGDDEKTAKAYCGQYPNAACCARLKGGSASASPSPKPQGPSKIASFADSFEKIGAGNPNSLLHSSAQADSTTSGSSTSAQGGSWIEQNKLPLIGASAGVAALIAAGVAVGVVRARRRSTVVPSRRGGGTTPLVSSARASMGASGAAAAAGFNGAAYQAKYSVLHEYLPALPDELELQPGDHVELLKSFDDGWGRGRNMRTGLEGTFPMACIEANRE
ncbi:hypothetical protein HK104_000392 [Borealophlyctis nickersoniae]|nr:hypothetical protein HK104_000392 [Borealophlyctis nickersoniae]